MSITSCSISLYETRRNLNNLKEMAKLECEVTFYRRNEEKQIPSSKLVPSDIIII